MTKMYVIENQIKILFKFMNDTILKCTKIRYGSNNSLV